MPGFSGGVKLGDLDDFISPSQECVKPLIEAAGGKGARLDTVDIQEPIKKEPLVQRPNLIKKKTSSSDPKATIGQVTLSDCLACSGCVTSAETVLLQDQSCEEFLTRATRAPLTVVSLSAEARTSLAEHFGVSPLHVMQKLTSALCHIGVTYILEDSAAEAISLLEGACEFVRRFKGARGNENPPGMRETCSSRAEALPLLTSHCPGWTCYAEKVVDPVVLPHLVPIRPPQQLQGRLVKTCLLEAHNRRNLYRWWRARSPLFAAECWWWIRAVSGGAVPPPKPLLACDLYHASVQPCFDRKIEAARPQFEVPGDGGVREVDTVLTTTEILELLQSTSLAGNLPLGEPAAVGAAEVFAAIPCCPAGSEAFTDLLLGDIGGRAPGPLVCCVRDNAGSGGFIEHVFREAARELFQLPIGSSLDLRTLQNSDMREVSLEDPQSKRVLLNFVSAYGFRNIQNIIKRITRSSDAGLAHAAGRERLDFVEIMACPGGCLNGGGQVPPPKGATPTEKSVRMEVLEGLMHDGKSTVVVPPSEHPLVLPLYRFIASNARESASCGVDQSLKSLIGGDAARSWLQAEWRSLKVDAEGNQVMGASVLKW